MNRRQNRSSRFEVLHHSCDGALSLSPLRRVLTAARKDLPPRAACLPDDASDRLALKLIHRIRLQFKRSHPAGRLGSALRLDFKETAGIDV